MNWREVLPWFAPAFAWVALWTQFATLGFFNKAEGNFKDWVSSGAKDLAISNIEAVKLIPALASMCDAVADARAAKPPEELPLLCTEDILTEVDFLPHLANAEAALREKQAIERLLVGLQQKAAILWRVSLLHSFAIVILPTSFLIPLLGVRLTLALLASIVALITLVWLVHGSIRYQSMRDELLDELSINREVS